MLRIQPNLILTVTATPPAIGKSKSSLIEANLTVDSAGTWHDPVFGHVPDGIPVTFAVTSGPGSISPGSAVTADGVCADNVHIIGSRDDNRDRNG